MGNNVTGKPDSLNGAQASRMTSGVGDHSAGIPEGLATRWRTHCADHGTTFDWANDGRHVNGWVEIQSGGRLRTKWGMGTWHSQHTVPDVVVMTFGNAHHHCHLHNDGCFTVERKADRQTGDLKNCQTRGWPQSNAKKRKAANMSSQASDAVPMEKVMIIAETLLLCTRHRPQVVPDTFLGEPSACAEYNNQQRYDTVFEVTIEDSLEAARRVINDFGPAAQDNATTNKPLVLNMANRRTPGGGFLRGAAGQEEELCRRSTLYYELHAVKTHYPLPECSALISPDVVVTRDLGPDYKELGNPFRIAVITAAAPYYPNLLVESADGSRHAPGYEALMIRKIDALLHAAVSAGYRCIVLSAWGCGAYQNPASEVARLFRAAFRKETFASAFQRVVFAIVDRHEQENNRVEFERAFSDLLDRDAAGDGSVG